MPRRSASKLLVADFETTTDPCDCRVWAWALCEIDDLQVSYGNSIESFIEEISAYNSQTYFHNLAFDGSFILDYLLKQGFRIVMDKRMPKKTISTLISDSGKFYSITVMWESGFRTEFRDSLKKLPMSVSRIAKSFGFEEMKVEINYTAPREPGHVLTEEEKAYIHNDVVIVARALALQFQQGMTKLTVGSDSLTEYKTMLGPKEWATLFPVLDPDIDTSIRRAYRGGWTYSDIRFRQQVVGPVSVFDVNSLYPSVMYEKPLPYGVPIWRPGAPQVIPDRPLWVASVTFTGRLKPGHVPCIQVRGSGFYFPAEYQTEIVEPVTMSVTCVDFALWESQYNIDVLEWTGCWYFHSIEGVFCSYIDKWMEVKKNSTGGLREIAKLHLNSLYGKFATNPLVSSKFPELKDDALSLVEGPVEERDPVYLPMGVFITAWARNKTIRAAQDHYGVFAYADTDSLHLLTAPPVPGLDVDPVRLGAWKLEGQFDSAFFVRAKAYTEHSSECTCGRQDGGHDRGCGFHTHIAGLPASVADSVEFDDLYDGKVFDGKLLPKRVPGGIVLSDVKYTLSF